MSGGGEELLLGRLRAEPNGSVWILSPAVGWWIDPPPAGALLGAGSSFGRLACLSRRYQLVVPEGAAGRVVDGARSRRIVAVEYDEPLLRLVPLGAGTLELGDSATLGRPAGAHLPAGTRAVVAPSDGVFYGAPSPGAEPYVRVGQPVHLGQPIGIVEVMKTFHQLTYAGPGFPERAEVVELRGRDGGEVRAGEVLFLFR